LRGGTWEEVMRRFGIVRNPVVNLFGTLLTCFVVMGFSQSAHGEAIPDFYAHKQIRMIVGYISGNDYDIGTRLLAKYLPKHIPGRPVVIVQNMPQASSIVAANYTYNQAPRDGTVMAVVTRNLTNLVVLGERKIEADPRSFNWLGATSFPFRVCVVGRNAPAKTPADLLTRELIVGGSGAANINNIIPTLLNHVLGTKFRIVEGYRGSPEIILAVERGEVEGLCNSYGNFKGKEQQFRDGSLRILFHTEDKPVAEIPGVPSMYELVKTDDQRRLLRFVMASADFGRPYVFPPDVPKERVEIMRRAIAAATADPDLIAEAQKMNLDMTYRAPDGLERLVKDLYDTPAEILETVRKLVPNM
jgi:tripartite-type tricarboxylate transporter receptor subunit TctC